MRILLLGANGRTGTAVISEALQRGHTISALVRRPETLATHANNVSITTGSPLSTEDITKTFASAPQSDPIKAVISALNNGRTSDNPWAKPTAPTNLMADSVRNCVTVMKDYGVKKVVVLGTVGVGSSTATRPWWFNWIIAHSNLKIAFDDHYAVQQLLEAESGKDPALVWVDVRAVGLGNGEKKDVKEFGNDGQGAGWMIGRKSVAAFMLDAVENSRWDGQTPVISN